MNRERSNVDALSIKAEGAIYTPPELATFVAQNILLTAQLPESGTIRILDPAMGSGILLAALLAELEPNRLADCVAHGFETDPVALAEAETYLRKYFPQVQFHFHYQDFLAADIPQHRYDLAIANPPYVRTQVMGADQARRLAERYGLTGRVDLYYPFLMEIAEAMTPEGAMGVITSNRFLTTRSGQEIRKALLTRFRVRHVYDLGDTKLFDAAVLPAITIAQGPGAAQAEVKFSSIYETSDQPTEVAADTLSALEAPNGSVVAVGNIKYKVRHGLVDNGGDDVGVWRLATSDADEWLSTVQSNTWATFATIGKIRVGVKSTADKVFLRADWDLPHGEPELLMPLITRYCARRFRAAVPAKAQHRKRILYPHEVGPGGRRQAVDLDNYPRAKAYLESHRAQLEGREYVIKGGRQWFEIWVPQDPAAWAEPKLVFPDISERPTFWMDQDGGVVNGECYFLRSETGDPDLLWLALAVANSSFIEKFYDHCFNNKLYAGRRRWITQYVEKFPLPDPMRAESREMIRIAKEIYDLTGANDTNALERELDARVWEGFGLFPE